jgi:hypothetical protein
MVLQFFRPKDEDEPREPFSEWFIHRRSSTKE